MVAVCCQPIAMRGSHLITCSSNMQWLLDESEECNIQPIHGGRSGARGLVRRAWVPIESLRCKYLITTRSTTFGAQHEAR